MHRIGAPRLDCGSAGMGLGQTSISPPRRFQQGHELTQSGTHLELLSGSSGALFFLAQPPAATNIDARRVR
jgi:hypothetical protein